MGLAWVVTQTLCREWGILIHSVTKHFLNAHFPQAWVVHWEGNGGVVKIRAVLELLTQQFGRCPVTG